MPRREVVRVQQQAVVGERQEQRAEIAGRGFDVDRLTVAMCDQVVGRGRARRALQHRVCVGDGLRIQDGAQRDVIRHARFASVIGADERIGDQPDAARVHPGLGEQSGFHHGHVVRPVALRRIDDDDGIRGMQQPIPVLPDQRMALGAAARRHGERGALPHVSRRGTCLRVLDWCY